MGPVPFIIGALILKSRQRSSVGGGPTAKRKEDSEPIVKDTEPIAPWFKPKTVYAWPEEVKFKQMTPEDLVKLATVSNKIKELASEQSPSGQFKAPVRDPGLEKEFGSLMQLFASTIRQLEKKPLPDVAFWEKFGALLSLYQHFNSIRLNVGF